MNKQPPSSGWSTFTTLALVAGVVVVGAYALDLHSHCCEACGQRWRHFGAFNMGDPAAHTCKQCGTVQWWKDGFQHVFRDPSQMKTAQASQPQLPPAQLPPETRGVPQVGLASEIRLAYPGNFPPR